MDRDKLKWLFFDMGSTLIDESVAIEHRIREVIEGTDITYEQFLEKKVFFAKQNKPADLATLEYFGLKKTPWHKEDERLFPETVEMQQTLTFSETISQQLHSQCFSLHFIWELHQ